MNDTQSSNAVFLIFTSSTIIQDQSFCMGVFNMCVKCMGVYQWFWTSQHLSRCICTYIRLTTDAVTLSPNQFSTLRLHHVDCLRFAIACRAGILKLLPVRSRDCNCRHGPVFRCAIAARSRWLSDKFSSFRLFQFPLMNSAILLVQLRASCSRYRAGA